MYEYGCIIFDIYSMTTQTEEEFFTCIALVFYYFFIFMIVALGFEFLDKKNPVILSHLDVVLGKGNLNNLIICICVGMGMKFH